VYSKTNDRLWVRQDHNPCISPLNPPNKRDYTANAPLKLLHEKQLRIETCMTTQHLLAKLESIWIFLKNGRNASSESLQGLIREVDASVGYARNDARAKAKAWLVSHASTMGQEDILLAHTHFGYLLPVGWGTQKSVG
jgi:hypothetical protein